MSFLSSCLLLLFGVLGFLNFWFLIASFRYRWLVRDQKLTGADPNQIVVFEVRCGSSLDNLQLLQADSILAGVRLLPSTTSGITPADMLDILVNCEK